MIEAFAFVWLVSVIAATISAVQKHRSGCGWFIASLIFGPLALFGIWLMGDRLVNERYDQIKRGELTKCPACAELIKAEAVKCRFCGTELEP